MTLMGKKRKNKMKRALTVIVMSIGIVGCAVGSATIVGKSEDDARPRWAVVEVRTDTNYETQMKAAREQMEKYCIPERYKIVETNVTYRQAPKWIWTGTHMISAGDENQRWEYLKFICIASED